MADYCRWVKDESVPGGRYLVPGCWNRVVNGDEAECQCETHRLTDDPDNIDRCPHCGQIVEGEP